jgi:hypothetical protein
MTKPRTTQDYQLIIYVAHHLNDKLKLNTCTRGTTPSCATSEKDPVNGNGKQSRIMWADVVRTGRVAHKKEERGKIALSALS